MASYAYVEHVGVKRHALGSSGEIKRLYTRIELSSAHLTISAASPNFCLKQQPTQYTFQFAKRLLDDRGTRDDNDIKALPQAFVQAQKYRPQTPPAPVANDCIAKSLRGHDAIAVVGRFAAADADHYIRMTEDRSRSPNASEVGRKAQSQCGSHQLTGVPVCFLHMVWRHRQFVTAPQPARL